MKSEDEKSFEQKKPVEAGEILEMSEDDLEQVNGGTDSVVKNTSGTTFGVQKDKMKSANKNAEQVKGLL
ncbi:MAG: hypothetical protein J0I20_24625 [Chloroflexi bacterium]|nr:hypothetical protein [Chloroflexota bacterium]OJV99762.1 MAG: hypothetical protein BGO39_12505 [Chloroflexi bacterium 54-19]